MAISRIDVTDWIAMGKKIAEWAKDAATRPANATALRAQLQNIATIPDRITQIQFAQPDLATFLVRLPNAEMLTESETRAKEHPDDPYAVPTFYFDKVCPGGAGMANEDFLYSRVADYTIQQCR